MSRFFSRRQEVESLFLAGFSKHQIAELTGVHKRNIFRYLNDHSTPDALARPLDVAEKRDYVRLVGWPFWEVADWTPDYRSSLRKVIKNQCRRLTDLRKEFNETPGAGELLDNYEAFFRWVITGRKPQCLVPGI